MARLGEESLNAGTTGRLHPGDYVVTDGTERSACEGHDPEAFQIGVNGVVVSILACARCGAVDVALLANTETKTALQIRTARRERFLSEETARCIACEYGIGAHTCAQVLSRQASDREGRRT